MEKSTLMKCYSTDEVCVVPSGTKAIVAGAFEGNDSIKRVVLPDGLEEIGFNSFAEMENLERVVVPESVRKIGASAFANCPNLSSAYLGKDLSQIGSSIFAGCQNLKSVDVSDENNYLTCIDGVIYSADKTVLYEMLPGREKSFFVFPDTVAAISPYAFWGCDNLEHTIISESIGVIPPYAFSNARNLKSAVLSFNTREISMKAFENCVSLEQVYIPDSVMNISPTAFDGCPKLSIYANEMTEGKKFAEENEFDVLYTPKYDLNLATDLRNEYASEQSKKRQEGSSYDEDVHFDASKDDSLGAAIIVNNNAVVLMDPEKLKVSETSSDRSSNESEFDTILGESIYHNIIPDNLFYLKSDLTEVTIPSDTKYIGKFAFARTGLKKVEIPSNVVSIGFGAFYHCDDLKEVIIPDTVTEIEPQAFEKTAWLNDWYENGESDYLIVGDGILIAYKGSKEDYVKPDNVKSVACEIN